jgi:hypothetical protein
VTRGSARTIVLWIVVGVGLLVGASALVVSSAYSRRPLEDYVAKLKADGEPVTMAQAIGAPPSTEENGAPGIVEAWREFVRRNGELESWNVAGPWRRKDYWDWTTTELSDVDAAALRAALVDAKRVFDAVEAARTKPRFRLDDSGADRAVEGVLSLLAVRAVVAADSVERLSGMQQLAWIATRWERCDVRSERAAALAMRRAAAGVRIGLVRGDVDAAAARARLDAALATPWLPRFRAVVRFQRAQEIERANDPDFFEFPDRSRNAKPSPLVVMHERARELVRTWREGGRYPWHSPALLVARLSVYDLFEKLPTESYVRMRNAAIEIRSRVGEFSDIEWLGPNAWDLTHTDACCRLARVALAVAEHRAKHGDFPASLDELKPMFPDGVPLDPYTDAPFVYERTSAGARIASVGRLSEGKPLDDTTLRERCLVWELKR